jgi:LL-H family phage holin
MLANLGIDLTQLLGQILILVVTVVLPLLAKLIGSFVSKKIAEADNELLARVAGMAVLWVEQKYGDISGTEKFQKAYEYIAEKLAKMHIKVDASDIEKVIEATLQGFAQSTSDLKNE